MSKSLFTAKHHRLIAQAIYDSRTPLGHSEDVNEKSLIDTRLLIGILISMFRMDNSKFSADGFRFHCGDQSVTAD